jgi:hypothetical protein
LPISPEAAQGAASGGRRRRGEVDGFAGGLPGQTDFEAMLDRFNRLGVGRRGAQDSQGRDHDDDKREATSGAKRRPHA